MPEASSRLIDAIRTIVPPVYSPSKTATILALTADQLKPGMVLAERFEGDNQFQLNAGHRLSEAMIYRLAHLTESSSANIQAVVG